MWGFLSCPLLYVFFNSCPLGSGAWWSDAHPKNLSEPLPGRVQTNQRAELFAVIRVLETEPRALQIKTDSQYVLDGCRRYRHVWAAAGWKKMHNSDLWKRLHALIEARPGQLVISKVKGHATARDVRLGRATPEDKHGKDAADALAEAGAAQHLMLSAGRSTAMQ